MFAYVEKMQPFKYTSFVSPGSLLTSEERVMEIEIGNEGRRIDSMMLGTVGGTNCPMVGGFWRASVWHEGDTEEIISRGVAGDLGFSWTVNFLYIFSV